MTRNHPPPPSDPFAARKWQVYRDDYGIPNESLPPDHYDLLGLTRFESDRETILAAAQQRFARLKAVTPPLPPKLFQELFEETKQAKEVLISTTAKPRYDQHLHDQLAEAGLLTQGELVQVAGRPSLSPPRRRSRKTSIWSLVISILMGPITVFGGYWLMGGFDKFGSKPNQTHRKEGVQPQPSPSPVVQKPNGTPVQNPSVVEPGKQQPTGGPEPNIAEASPDNEPTIPLQPVPVIHTWEEFAQVSPVEIPANREVGMRMGTLNQGWYLLVQYVDGTWSSHEGGLEESPDADQVAAGAHRLVISSRNFDDEVTRRMRVQGGTRAEPFLDQVDEDVAEWQLSMDDRPQEFEDNTGVVRYRIARIQLGDSFSPDASKLAIPSLSDRRSSTATLRKTFRKAYAGIKKPLAAQKLADQFFKQSQQTEKPLEKYVLLDEARNLAVISGGLELTMSIITEMAEHFQIDELADKVVAIDETARRITTSQQAAVLEPYLKELAGQLAEKHRFDEALGLATELSNLGSRIRSSGLRRRANELRETLTAQQTDKDKSAVLGELLGKDPEGSRLERLLGQFLALQRGDWNAGLRHLAKGDDRKLQSLAKQDLAQPEEPKPQEELGNAWREYADTLPESAAKTAALQRAGDWYLRAESQLKDAEKAHLTSQLENLGEVKNLLHEIRLDTAPHQGNWTLENGVLTSPIGAWSHIQTNCTPPEEYQVIVEAEWVGHSDSFVPGRDAVLIGLTHADRQFMAALDWDAAGGDKPSLTGFIELDNEFSWALPTPVCHIAPPTLTRGQKNTIDVFVRTTGVTIQVNGNPLLTYEGNYDRLQLGTRFQKTPELQPDKLFLGTHHAAYRFSKFEVRRLVPELP